jgi:hypothetical protein
VIWRNGGSHRQFRSHNICEWAFKSSNPLRGQWYSHTMTVPSLFVVCGQLSNTGRELVSSHVGVMDFPSIRF